MHRLPEKFLATLLALLLGLSPLQGLLAGVTQPAEQGRIQQMTGMHHAHNIAVDQPAEHDCPQCEANHCSGGHACCSNLCYSCALALVPTFAHARLLVLFIGTQPDAPALVNPFFLPLLHPPRG